MSPNSPFYLFDPESIGWLHRKVENGDFITGADLARIGNADPSTFADPVFQEQALLGLDNRLPVRRGCPPEHPIVWWKTLFAAFLIHDRAAEIRVARKADGKGFERGSPGPRQQAAEEIARGFRMHMSGQALLNRISAQKNA